MTPVFTAPVTFCYIVEKCCDLCPAKDLILETSSGKKRVFACDGVYLPYFSTNLKGICIAANKFFYDTVEKRYQTI